MDHLSRFFEKFDSGPGATDEQIASAEAELGTKLQAGYVEFLKSRNGGEGVIGESYAALWEVSELASKNSSYESQKWAPGILLFGSDGGGEAFGFDTRDSNWPIVQIPFIGMYWEEARPLGSTFSQFVENLYVWNRL
jgi:hypothetical protein